MGVSKLLATAMDEVYGQEQAGKKKSISDLMREYGVTTKSIPPEERTAENRGMADLYKDGKRIFRGVASDVQPFLEKLSSKGTKDAVREMSRADAIAAIVPGVPKGALDGWFRNEDGNFKAQIARAFRGSKDVRDAALNIFHQQWLAHTGGKLSLEDFLDSRVTVYRGGEKPKVGGSVFTSYSLDPKVAKGFADRYGAKDVHSITVVPRETFGMMQTTAEGEVLVPA